MVALVDSGVPTSRAAAALAEPAAGTEEPMERPAEGELVAAAASLDPDLLADVIGRAFASGSFEETIDEWLMPEVKRLGMAWDAGDVTAAQEHFASAGLMRAITGVFEGASPDGPSTLVGLPAGERHELALFCFAACLRRRGVSVTYLGADVPIEDWEVAVADRPPRAVVVGVTSDAAVPGAREIVHRLASTYPAPMVWLGGPWGTEVGGAHQLPNDVVRGAGYLSEELRAGRGARSRGESQAESHLHLP